MREQAQQRHHKITVMVSEDEHDMIARMAYEAGFASIASYIRAALLLEEGYFKQILQLLPRATRRR